MKPFMLKIVTPYGVAFEGQAEELILRATNGDIGFLANHADTVAALGKGIATVVIDGEKHRAACEGGVVSVEKGIVTLITAAFSWTEDKTK